MIIVGITTNTQPHMNHESWWLPRFEAATILCLSHLPRGLFEELVGCVFNVFSGQVRTTCSAHLHLRNKCQHTLSHTHTHTLLHAAQVLWSSVNNVLYLPLQALLKLCINRLMWQVCLWCLSRSWPDMTWIHYHPSNVCKTPEFWMQVLLIRTRVVTEQLDEEENDLKETVCYGLHTHKGCTSYL